MNDLIHRPTIGRLLCFLYLLGEMCSVHSEEYGEIIEHMQSIIGLSVSVTLLFDDL
jgi:hypothetical protein